MSPPLNCLLKRKIVIRIAGQSLDKAVIYLSIKKEADPRVKNEKKQ